MRARFGKEEGGGPEQGPHVEPSLSTSAAAPSPPEAIREEATPLGEAAVPVTSLCESAGAAPVQLPVCLEDAMREALTRTNEQRHDWIEQRGRPQREVTRGRYRRLADFVVSTTDPDATLMPTKGEGRHLGYHTHYVVDGGKSRIILAALVTPSEVMENQPMLDLAFRVRFRWKLWPRQVTGDTTYGTIDNIVAGGDQHTRPHAPPPPFVKRRSLHGKHAFLSDPASGAP